jgi:two-component system, OmpR family, phosphate regulon sensor histidine kinase PhoR
LVIATGWTVAAASVFLGWRGTISSRARETLDLQATIAAQHIELCLLSTGKECGLPILSAPDLDARILPDSSRLLPEGDPPTERFSALDGRWYLVSEKPVPGKRIVRLSRALEDVSMPRSAWILAGSASLVGTLLPLVLLLGLLRRERLRTEHLVETARAADGGLPLPVAPSGASGEESSLVASLGSDLRRRRILSKWEERRLARLLDSLSEGVLLLDGRLRVLVCNSSGAKALGLRHGKAAVRGRPIVSLTRDLVFLDDLRKSVSRSTSSSFDVERDDSVFSTRVWPVPADAEGTGWLVTMQDVTAQRRAERLQSRLVSDASHEFKTPLTSIRGWTETLLEDEEDDFRRKALDRVVQGTRHLEEVVRDMLDLGRIAEANRAHKPLVQLTEVCSEAMVALEAESSRKRVKITSRCPPTASLPGFHGQLVRAVINLLSNAVRYSPEGSTVTVSVVPGPGGQWWIEVADNGPGIPAEALPHLFERFYRADHGRSRDLGGTGLGLAIVQETARAHGGKAEVESTQGVGSTFRVMLANEPGT